MHRSGSSPNRYSRADRLVAALTLGFASLVLLSFSVPSITQAQSADQNEVRFAVVGNRNLDGTITGETVPVYVPWEGVNVDQPTVACLAGEFRLQSAGEEERASIGQGDAVALLLRLDSVDSGTWEVRESSGRCAVLDGRGSFRRTSWADGSVSYRFIGEARIDPPDESA